MQARWRARLLQVAQDTILVLDFGSQYSQLIARRVREAKVYCELVPGNISAEEIRRRDPRGFIFSGGPGVGVEPGAPHPGPRGDGLKIPILGICYGMDLLAVTSAAGCPLRSVASTDTRR